MSWHAILGECDNIIIVIFGHYAAKHEVKTKGIHAVYSEMGKKRSISGSKWELKIFFLFLSRSLSASFIQSMTIGFSHSKAQQKPIWWNIFSLLCKNLMNKNGIPVTKMVFIYCKQCCCIRFEGEETRNTKKEPTTYFIDGKFILNYTENFQKRKKFPSNHLANLLHWKMWKKILWNIFR